MQLEIWSIVPFDSIACVRIIEVATCSTSVSQTPKLVGVNGGGWGRWGMYPPKCFRHRSYQRSGTVDATARTRIGLLSLTPTLAMDPETNHEQHVLFNTWK
jgi:hypothetical protein